MMGRASMMEHLYPARHWVSTIAQRTNHNTTLQFRMSTLPLMAEAGESKYHPQGYRLNFELSKQPTRRQHENCCQFDQTTPCASLLRSVNEQQHSRLREHRVGRPRVKNTTQLNNRGRLLRTLAVEMLDLYPPGIAMLRKHTCQLRAVLSESC